MPPVPNTPEPLERLRQRYPAALETVYDVAAIEDKGAIRPGEVAAQIFDFEDGLRFIVSRERMRDGEIVLHFSASFPGECRMADEWRLLKITTPIDRIRAMWEADMPRRFRELSGTEGEIEFIGRSAEQIPHFFVKET